LDVIFSVSMLVKVCCRGGLAMFSVQEVQEHLDTIDQVKARLAREKRKRVDASEYGELGLVLGEIAGWGTAYGETSVRLGIAPATLSKFMKMRGPVSVVTVRAVAERLRTFVRSLDHATPEPPPAIEPVAIRPRPPALSFRGEQWVAVPRQSDVGQKIATLAAILGSIIEQVNRSNLPDEEQALSPLEREQLIALLETALVILKSPLVEKGLLRKTGESLKNAAGKAAEKQTQEGLGKLMGTAVKKLWELADLLPW
jgi:hypothetical protein